MNSIFGDATTMAPTPETLAEVESIFSGNRSPVPSFRLNDGDTNVDPEVPDLEIEPPAVKIQDGKPILPGDGQGLEGLKAVSYTHLTLPTKRIV